jgi:lycopene cyclase domain-containing protein
MEYLYLWLNIGSFTIPFIFSFHPKLQFYKKWKTFAIGTFFMMAFFISWDVIFTNNGIWGFNDAYITGYKILNLPIEEWLFFICIPYACIFSHHSLSFLIKNWEFSEKATSVFYVSLQCILIITLWYAYDKWYTLINFAYTIILLGLVYNYKPHVLAKFLPTFLVILIPFFIVNGILTGSGIEEQVVWYNNTENLGIRILTVPIEDSIYALGMLLTVLVIMEHIEFKKATKESA